jgi:hypothetical protein
MVIAIHRQSRPEHASFFVPNFITRLPKNRLSTALVTWRILSVTENRLRLISSLSVTGLRNSDLVLEQNPKAVKIIKKHTAATTQR